MCHQRGSVVAEVVLRKVKTAAGASEGDCRSAALLAQELVEVVRQKASDLRGKPLGQFAQSAQIDGPIAEPVCDLVTKALRARGADWHEQLQQVSSGLNAKLEQVASRHLGQCRRVIKRLLSHQLATAFNTYLSRLIEVRDRRLASKRIVSRMLHTHLAAAFDGFQEAVEQLIAHRQMVLRAVSRWQAPMLQIAFDMWCEFMGLVQAEQQEAAHEKAKQMLALSLEAEGEAVKHQKTIVEKECQRRMEMCRKTVQRMFHIALATAFDSFVDRVRQLKARKTAAKRVIRRMLHTQLAGAFDFFSQCVAQLAEHRRVVQSTVARWQQPRLRVFFDGWLEALAVLQQEISEEASLLAQERLSRELDDAVREHREHIDALKEKRQAGLRGILQRIAHSQLAMVFDSFSEAVRVRKERKDECRKIVGRMLHCQLSDAFELYHEGVMGLKRHRHLVEQAMSHWRRPALTQAWDLWLDYCEAYRAETAAIADAQVRRQLDDKMRALQDGLVANRERQRLTGGRVVARMLHSRLAAVFDGFVVCVVASQERRELARSVVRRMRRLQLAKAFERFVSASCKTREQTSLLDAFADASVSRMTRYYEKKCFFVLWCYARQMRKQAMDLVREADVKHKAAHLAVWRHHTVTMQNARKLSTRISGAEEVRQVSLALHAWVRWHDRIKMLSAQVAMGHKKAMGAGPDLHGLAGVPAGSDASVTALCAFSIWRIHVERCVRSQMQSRISVLIQTIANLSNEPSTTPRSTVYSSYSSRM